MNSSPPNASPGTAIALSWNQPAGLIGLSFTNAVLRIVTLGIYGFWAKTEVRKRIWSGIRIEGEPLQYTGTGMELFKGFIIVLAVLLVPTFVVLTAAIITFGPGTIPVALVQVGLYLMILFLFFFGIYRATRYRLSRTLWRGIRGGLDGSAGAYAMSSMWRLFANILTLCWLTPLNSVRLQGMITNNMRFGQVPFRFTATSGRLYGPFALLWVGLVAALSIAFWIATTFVITPDMFTPGQPPRPPSAQQIGAMIGIYVFVLLTYAVLGAWYGAVQLRHFAAHTHYDGATFQSRATAPGLIWLALTNFFIVLFSIGILMPVAQARTARYLVQTLSLDGTVRLEEILQGAPARRGVGEGLAQAFDLDAFA